jgi:hypothetical protein
MGRIYKGATKVFSCFGDASAEKANDLISLVHDLEPTVRKGKVFVLREDDPLWNDSRLESLAMLTNRPWYTRAWGLQEVGLATNPCVLFGTAEVNYRVVMDITSAFPLGLTTKFNIQTWIVHLAWAEFWLHQLQSSNRYRFTFLDLLGHASFLDCKDPRDRIYAFLGHPLARAYTGVPLIRPNYEKSPDKVYLEVTTRLLEVEGLRVITKVNNTETSLAEDLPSWVVRWDACRINNRIYYSLASPFRASARFKQDTSEIIHDNCLKLGGVEVDKVIRSYQILPIVSPNGELKIPCQVYRDISTGQINDLRGVMKYLEEEATPCAYNYSKDDALCLTLACCPTEEPRLDKDLDLQMILYCPNRSFFITEKGFYGLGPDTTRPGDLCCVLFGAHVPFILRSLGGNLKLLGEAYVRGLMGGEVEEMLRKGEVSTKRFDIY